MPLNNPTRITHLRRLLSLIISFGFAPVMLHAAPTSSADSFLSVVSDGVSSTRLRVDLTTLSDQELQALTFNPTVVGAQINRDGGAAPNTLVRWALIPPDCGVELKISNVVSRPEDSGASPSDASLPSEFARLGRPAILRGYRVVPIYISPTITDETGRGVRRLESAEFELDFSSAANRVNLVNNPLRPRPSRYARKLVEQLVVNPPTPSRDDNPTGGSILYVLGEWNNVEQALAPLVEWRRRMGWQVQTLRVGENNDRTEILAAIQDVYNNADVTPEYIVLVGDAPRAHDRNPYTLAFFNVQDGAEFAYETDQPYVNLEGDDLLPDAAIGRLPFTTTVAPLQGMVAKTINYESTPYLGQNANERGWQLRGAVAATDSRSGLSSVDLCNWFKDLTLSHGYTRIDELFYSPNDPQPNPTDFIAETVGSGASFFLYRGWADMSGYEPNRAGQLRNGRMLSFVMLATCNTGEYAEGNQGSPWTYTERFLTNANGGAIGAVGAAGATHTAYNNLIAAGTLAAPFRQAIYSQGWALQQGKMQLMRAYRGLGDIQHEENRNVEAWLTEFYIFNLMGDPAVDLVTAIPRAITVENEAQIRVGETFYEADIAYADDGAPVAGANVCLYKSGVFQSVQTTNADGHAEFTLDPDWTQDGTIKLTITGRNLIPRLADLNVAQAANMIGVESWTLDDDAEGESSGNNDGIANPIERIEATVQIRNYGQQRPNGAMIAVLESLSPYASIARDTLNFNAAPARGARVSGIFLIDLHGDCPDGFEPAFRLKASVGGQDFFSSFSIPVGSPALEYASVRWSGNPLTPASTAGLSIILTNNGSMDAPPTNAELISLTNSITVPSAQTSFPQIRENQSGESNAGLRLAATRRHVPGSPANLALVMENDNGFADTVFFSVPVGQASATTPFGPDKYGYICIDDTDTGWVTRPTYNWMELDPGQGGNGTNLQIVDRFEEADTSVLIDLPFEFTYYGAAFNTLTVCSNGWAAFGDHHTLIGGRNRRIPCGELIPAMLAPFWDDLVTTANGGVFSLYDEANHRYIIEWSTMRKLGPQNAGEPLETFELILYDPQFVPTFTGDGEIVFQYQDVADAQSCYQAWDTPFATVGIGNLDCTDGLEYSYWGRRTAGAAALRDNRAIKFTTVMGAEIAWVAGRITDSQSGAPITRASVRAFNGVSTTTGADGRYLLMLPFSEAGAEIAASAQFYNDSTATNVQVAVADTTELNFALLKPLMSLSRDTLQLECRSNAEFTDSLVVHNDGNGRLIFSCAVEEAQRDRVSAGVDWLSFSPHNDTLAASESSVIHLEINPIDLEEGEYHANLIITHNARPGSQVVPVTLLVSLDAPGDPTKSPYRYELSQNFPNPFNGSTTINFELASGGPVKLTILDINGREQLRLLDGWRPQGRYSVPLSADHLPAGVYFCRLEAGGAIKIRKLALMK